MITRSSTHSVKANYCDILSACAMRNHESPITVIGDPLRNSILRGIVLAMYCFLFVPLRRIKMTLSCICSVMANNDYSDKSSWSRTCIHSDLVVARKKKKELKKYLIFTRMGMRG